MIAVMDMQTLQLPQTFMKKINMIFGNGLLVVAVMRK